MNLDWIAGFFDGEGSVSLQIYRKADRRCGYGFTPRITITQAAYSQHILKHIQSELDLGGLCRCTRGVSQLEFRKLDAVSKFIQLFTERSHVKKTRLCLLAKAVSLLQNRKKKTLSKKTIIELLRIAAQIRDLNNKRRKHHTDAKAVLSRLETMPK